MDDRVAVVAIQSNTAGSLRRTRTLKPSSHLVGLQHQDVRYEEWYFVVIMGVYRSRVVVIITLLVSGKLPRKKTAICEAIVLS